MSNSLPGFMVIRLGDKAIKKARERIRGAIKNRWLYMPSKRPILNPAPTDLPRDGGGYDLGMAITINVSSGQIGWDL